MNKRTFLCRSISAAIALGNGALYAQAPGAAPASKRQLEEVIVTAQRRSEAVQDVPASIAVLSADALQSAGVANTTDLAKMVPGMTMNSYGGFLQPSIRGITSTGANLGENSNVAMYIDGVYQPQQIATLMDLPDVQQVEVLKGPQGALYGQNATGGAILISTKEPSFEPGGRVSASYGNYDAKVVQAYVTGPIVGPVAGSLAGGYQDRDGFREHVITGESDKGLDSKVIRGKLLMNFTDKVDATVSAYHSDREDSANYAGFAIDDNSVGYALGVPAPRPRHADEFSADPDVFTQIKSDGVSLRVGVETAYGVVKSVSGYSENEIQYLSDADYTAINGFVLTADPLTARYVMQDLNFASEKFGMTSFLVGAFYLEGKEAFKDNHFDMLVPSVPPAPVTFAARLSDQDARVEKEVQAAYAEVSIQPTDTLTLTFGGRYTHEEQHTYSDFAIFPGGTGVQEKKAQQEEYPGDPVVFEKFTPRITAKYELTPSSNIYASWGKGFKSGVVNTTDFTRDPVDPETVTAYEVGYKGMPLDTLQFNIAAFYYDYEDMQAVVYEPGKSYFTQNAATASIKGVDIDAVWAATDNLTLQANVSFLDAEYDDFTDAVNFVPNGFGHNPPSTIDLSGKPILRSPDYSGSITAIYERPTDIGLVGANLSAYFSDNYGMEQTGRIQQDAYHTVSAELSLKPEGYEGLRLALWGKNLTDEEYYLSALVVGTLVDGGSYAEPRTYGVSAQYEF